MAALAIAGIGGLVFATVAAQQASPPVATMAGVANDQVGSPYDYSGLQARSYNFTPHGPGVRDQGTYQWGKRIPPRSAPASVPYVSGGPNEHIAVFGDAVANLSADSSRLLRTLSAPRNLSAFLAGPAAIKDATADYAEASATYLRGEGATDFWLNMV